MDWDAIGAVAEILGAIGVLATLIYLARQIRHATDVAWSQNTNATNASVQQMMLIQSNADIRLAIEKCYFSNEPLDSKEMILLEAYLVPALMQLEAEFNQAKRGLITMEQWERKKASLQGWFGAKPPKIWWEYNKHTLDPAFVEDVNEVIVNAPSVAELSPLILAEVNKDRSG